MVFISNTMICCSQEFNKIENNAIFCYEGNSDFTVFKVTHDNKTFNFTYPTDICETIEHKIKLNSEPEEAFLMTIDDTIQKKLSLKESYWSCLPIGSCFLNHNKSKVCLLEFSLISYMGGTGYNYIVVDYTDLNRIISKEISSSNRITISELLNK